MKVPKTKNDLSCVEFNSTLWKSLFLCELVEKFTSFDEFHDEVKLAFILEDVFHRDEERVFHLNENVFLKKSALDLVIFYQDVLSNGLHGIVLSVVFLLNEKHLAEASFAQDFLHNEVFKADFVILATVNSPACPFSLKVSITIGSYGIYITSRSWLGDLGIRL